MRTLAGLAAAVLGLAIWYGLYQGHDILRFTLPEENPPASWWIAFVCGYLVLLVGAFLGVVCRHLIERRKSGESTVEIGTVLKASLQQIELWVSFFGSPLIYGWILRVGADLAFGPFLYFALQTGFSSYVVLNSLIGSSPMPAGADPGEAAAKAAQG